MSSRPEPAAHHEKQTARVTTTVLTMADEQKTGRQTAPPANPAAEPRVRGAIAVLMLRFPHLADTFVLREINELERQGQPVVVVPILHGHQRVVHEEAKPWVS